MEHLAQIAILAVTLTTIVNANLIIEPHGLNGTAVIPGQFPYSVFFLHKSSNSSYAGGAIIGSKYILTSANAIDLYDGWTYGYQIMVGCVEPYSPYCVQHEVQEAIKHPGYDDGNRFKDNIAIIVLAKDIEFNQFARVIPLSTMHVGKNTTIIGTGMELAEELRLEWEELISIDDVACKAKWPEANLSQSFCTVPEIYGGLGTYGHPVALFGHVVGIAFDWRTQYNLITRVEPYLIWILNTMQGTNIV